MNLKYKRILLKLSGQALMGNSHNPFDSNVIARFSKEIKDIYLMGVELAIVIGGGNIYRGIDQEKSGIERVQGDYMGMLATIINALALQASIEKLDVPTRVMSGLTITRVAETYIRRKAIRHLEKKRIVIFGGGTTNPFFSTDSAAVLRALEINADIILKGTRVDGVFDKDPEKFSNVRQFHHLSFNSVIEKKLSVMDQTAFTLCSENKLPIIVFNIFKENGIKKILEGEQIGTLIN